MNERRWAIKRTQREGGDDHRRSGNAVFTFYTVSNVHYIIDKRQSSVRKHYRNANKYLESR